MQVNNRLFEIIYLLIQKKKMTAKELADRFEVSTRTIYRDIEALSSANIPVYMSKGKDGGIGILEEYVLNKSILSEEEQNQILWALQSLEKMNGQTEIDVLEKMSMIFHKKIKEWIKIDFSGWSPSQENTFQIVKSAILNKQLIEFIYYNSMGEQTSRIVEPLQIWFKDKSWYLISYCRLKKDYRFFKLTRIKEIQLLEEHFERELPEQKGKVTKVETILLEVEISKEMAFRVYDEFDGNEITKKEDGNFLVKTEFPKNEWVYSFLLSFGEDLKVISPKYAKDIIKDKLQKTLKNYG